MAETSPPLTPVPLHVSGTPTCPTCGAPGMRCLRPSGHEADRWHVAREDALAELCRCTDVCIPWLRSRGLPTPVDQEAASG